MPHRIPLALLGDPGACVFYLQKQITDIEYLRRHLQKSIFVGIDVEGKEGISEGVTSIGLTTLFPKNIEARKFPDSPFTTQQLRDRYKIESYCIYIDGRKRRKQPEPFPRTIGSSLHTTDPRNVIKILTKSIKRRYPDHDIILVGWHPQPLDFPAIQKFASALFRDVVGWVDVVDIMRQTCVSKQEDLKGTWPSLGDIMLCVGFSEACLPPRNRHNAGNDAIHTIITFVRLLTFNGVDLPIEVWRRWPPKQWREQRQRFSAEMSLRPRVDIPNAASPGTMGGCPQPRCGTSPASQVTEIKSQKYTHEERTHHEARETFIRYEDLRKIYAGKPPPPSCNFTITEHPRGSSPFSGGPLVMAAPKVDYTSLTKEDRDEAENTPFLDLESRRSVRAPTHPPMRSSTFLILVTSLACNVLFLIIIVTSLYSLSNCGLGANSMTRTQALYSPAQHLLRPILRKFSRAFNPEGEDRIFQQEPSPEVDAAWKGLYYKVLAIDRAAAEQLPNKTVPLSRDPDARYLTGLSVFHDLHCLDSIRKALWAGSPSTNGSTSAQASLEEMHDPAHLMHCVNGLRQTLMCHADVAPLSWQWSEKDKDVRVYQDVLHQCNDFSQILEWGREHNYEGDLDTSVWPDRHPPEVGACGYADEGCRVELL